MFDIDQTSLMLGVVAGILGLAGFVIASWTVGLAATAGFAFVVLAPFTAADEIAFSFQLKLARIGTTAFAFGVWLGVYRLRGLGLASVAWLIFIAGFTAAGLYSPLPRDAIFFKGLLLLTTLTGFAMIASLRGLDGVTSMARAIGLGGAVFIIAALGATAANPSQALGLGRLTILGMNPNRTGVELAAAAVFLIYLGLYDPNRIIKLTALALTAASGLLIAVTGSRAGVGFFFINALILGLPLVRRPVLLAVLMVLVGGAANIALAILKPETAERLGQVNFDTRADIWGSAFDKIRESPLIGHGWHYFQATAFGRVTSANAHSIYLQTMVETGAIGATVLAMALIVISWCLLTAFRPARDAGLINMYTLTAALIIGPVAHGIGESSTLTGASPNALFLAMGIALLDMLRRTIPTMMADEQAALADYGELDETDESTGHAVATN